MPNLAAQMVGSLLEEFEESSKVYDRALEAGFNTQRIKGDKAVYLTEEQAKLYARNTVHEDGKRLPETIRYAILFWVKIPSEDA